MVLAAEAEVGLLLELGGRGGFRAQQQQWWGLLHLRPRLVLCQQ